MSDTEPWTGPLPAAPGCDCHVCRPDESYDEQDRRVIDTVLKHGWQVLMVAEGAGCGDPEHQDHSESDHDNGPAFAYSIGLGHRVGHPELLMSGLDPHLMHRCLNGVAQRIMDGLGLEPGDALEEVLAGVSVAVEEVTDVALAETVTWSGWFHRRKPEALAIVWPDRNGVFGWQPGAPSILNDVQPTAWRSAIDHTGASGHETDDIRVVHLAHLVRSAPTLQHIADLAQDEEAWRNDPDSP